MIMHVESTTTQLPRRVSARTRKADRPNAVKPTRSPPQALGEIDLIRAYQAGDARAGSALLQTHAALIQETARPYFHGFHRDDVLQEVRLGFLDGVKRFEEGAGDALTTYAMHWMRGSAERYLAEHGSLIRVPQHAQRKTANERAKGLAQTATRCVRLDAPLGDEGGQARGDLLGDEDGETLVDVLSDGGETPETLTSIASRHALYRRVMAGLLQTLSPLEREILLCRVMAEKGSEETCAAVGARIGASRAQVERMRRAVLKKLRWRLAMAGLKAMEDVDEADRETFARLPRVHRNDVE
jgi:RNA polymerase sigma factor (sigma-70 family)